MVVITGPVPGARIRGKRAKKVKLGKIVKK